MSLLIQYLVKLSVSLAVVWLFYQFILRRLTFYNSNRWYLLAYTLLSFVIPFVDISPLIENPANDIVQLVPSVHQYTIALEEASHCPVPLLSTQFDKWDFIAFGLMAVAAVLFLRFGIRYVSFLCLRQKAKLISIEGIKIYSVDENIIPFSFGNSVFINPKLHSEADLREIIKHEFVHIRQRHTVDIIWAEIVSILNWYNPFAWLLKSSIRQNLEFIADNKVVENGIDKKQYQYLLLKVIGNSQFSIATQFNFSSLKKRIAMMNKTKSARRQLGRFLFLFPVLAIILLSFRKSLTRSPVPGSGAGNVLVNDTVPGKTIHGTKGYHITIVDDNGNCTVVVKDKNHKEVKRLLLVEWNANRDHYESLYGELTTPAKEIEKEMKAKNPDIRTVTVKGDIATVTLKNGKTEVYTLTLSSDKKAFENRCGIIEIPIATAVAAETAVASKVVTKINTVSESIADEFEITDKKAVMKMRNGKIEEYDLADPKQKAAFEKKFGRIIEPSISATRAHPLVTVADETGVPVETTVTIAPAKEVRVISEEDAVTAVEEEEAITIEPEILLTLTQKTTKEELQLLQGTLKMKGFELSFDETEYKNGLLVKISGTIKSKDGEAHFTGVEFHKLIISRVKKAEKTYFRIDEVAKKRTLS